jgi:PTH1 family peptidyl-tRNA hydrolase
MRLIVGLGNPGPKYVWTPHNLGFLTLDQLAERTGIRAGLTMGKARVGQGNLAGTEVVVAKPLTYMNASGLAVRDLVKRFRVNPAEMIVIADDAALPWGTMRIRERGSAGGHNGLKSVIGALGDDEFIRIRLGIGPVEPGMDLADYVLQPMTDEQLEQAAETMDRAVEAIEVILTQGTAAAMNRFNRRAPGPNQSPDVEDSESGTN